MHHSDYMEDFNNAMGRPNSFGLGYGGFKPSKGSLLNTSVLDKKLYEINLDKKLNDIRGTDFNPSVSEVTTETDVTVAEPVAEKNYQATMVGARIGSSLGFIVALGYAFKVKSGFWKGWGYTILGSMALGGLGAGVGLAIDSSKNKNN